MCGDGQTDGAREGTDKNGSISIVKFGKWLSPEDRGALRLGSATGVTQTCPLAEGGHATRTKDEATQRTGNE